jgi:hypothetical protein
MRRRPFKVTTYLDEDDYALLRDAAYERSVSMGEVVRHCLSACHRTLVEMAEGAPRMPEASTALDLFRADDSSDFAEPGSAFVTWGKG